MTVSEGIPRSPCWTAGVSCHIGGLASAVLRQNAFGAHVSWEKGVQHDKNENIRAEVGDLRSLDVVLGPALAPVIEPRWR